MRGALVYPEPFWVHGCVGLRGQRLKAARDRFEGPAAI
jgi:hypothetical protein